MEVTIGVLLSITADHQSRPGHEGSDVNASNAVSAEISVSRRVIAVAAMKRSNGSRCAQSSVAARRLASADVSKNRPPCWSANPISRERNGSISGHLPRRTFWPISNRLMALIDTVSACSIASTATADRRVSAVSDQAHAWVSSRICFTQHLPTASVHPLPSVRRSPVQVQSVVPSTSRS